MPNFNPIEQSGLLDLLSALQGGLNPSQGYSILGDLLTQQQGRVQANQERLGSLTDLLTNAAAQGMPYGGAQAMADAYTPRQGYGQGVENALGALYPQATEPNPIGRPSPEMLGGGMVPPAQMTSPVAQPPQMTPTESIAVTKFEQDQLLQQDYTGLAADAAANAARGMDITQFKQQAAQNNPQLVAADPAMFNEIISRAYGVDPRFGV